MEIPPVGRETLHYWQNMPRTRRLQIAGLSPMWWSRPVNIPPWRSTPVELTKDNYPGSTRYNAATALLDRGYGRPAQSLDLHLSADAITKRLSDMTDVELAALEARIIAAAPIVLEATAEVLDDAGELPDGDVEDSPPDALAELGAYSEFVRGLTRCLTACQYSTRHGPSLSQTRALRQSNSPVSGNLAPFANCREWFAPEVLEARRCQLVRDEDQGSLPAPGVETFRNARSSSPADRMRGRLRALEPVDMQHRRVEVDLRPFAPRPSQCGQSGKDSDNKRPHGTQNFRRHPP